MSCSVSSNCSQLQAHEYGLPDLPGASCCIHCQILDVFHLPCHSVSSSAQGQAHFRLASLNCPVHHGICVVRSLEYRLHLAWPPNAVRCGSLLPSSKHSVTTRVLWTMGCASTLGMGCHLCKTEGNLNLQYPLTFKYITWCLFNINWYLYISVNICIYTVQVVKHHGNVM